MKGSLISVKLRMHDTKASVVVGFFVCLFFLCLRYISLIRDMLLLILPMSNIFDWRPVLKNLNTDMRNWQDKEGKKE